MVLVITSIELKSPFKFFALSSNALKIIRQLKKTSCLGYKSTGFWTSHYTMSLWDSRESMKDFAGTGAHKEAMRKSAQLANEIRIATVEVPSMISWKDAKDKLTREGRSFKFQ